MEENILKMEDMIPASPANVSRRKVSILNKSNKKQQRRRSRRLQKLGQKSNSSNNTSEINDSVQSNAEQEDLSTTQNLAERNCSKSETTCTESENVNTEQNEDKKAELSQTNNDKSDIQIINKTDVVTPTPSISVSSSSRRLGLPHRQRKCLGRSMQINMEASTSKQEDEIKCEQQSASTSSKLDDKDENTAIKENKSCNSDEILDSSINLGDLSSIFSTTFTQEVEISNQMNLVENKGVSHEVEGNLDSFLDDAEDQMITEAISNLEFEQMNEGNITNKVAKDMQKFQNDKQFHEFHTADYKKCEISEETVNKAKKLFTDIENLDENQINELMNKKSSKTIKNSQNLDSDDSKNPSDGFQFSEKGKQKIKDLFGDLQGVNQGDINHLLNKKSSKVVRKSLNFDSGAASSSSVGFKFASGTNAQLGEKGKQIVKNLYGDLENLNENHIDQLINEKSAKVAKYIQKFGVSGKINPLKSHAETENSPYTIQKFQNNEPFREFHTADYLKCKISEETLNKGKKVHKDIENLNKNHIDELINEKSSKTIKNSQDLKSDGLRIPPVRFRIVGLSSAQTSKRPFNISKIKKEKDDALEEKSQTASCLDYQKDEAEVLKPKNIMEKSPNKRKSDDFRNSFLNEDIENNEKQSAQHVQSCRSSPAKTPLLFKKIRDDSLIKTGIDNLENVKPNSSVEQVLPSELDVPSSSSSLKHQQNMTNKKNDNKTNSNYLSLSLKRKRDDNENLNMDEVSTPKRRLSLGTFKHFLDTPQNYYRFCDTAHTSTPKNIDYTKLIRIKKEKFENEDITPQNNELIANSIISKDNLENCIEENKKQVSNLITVKLEKEEEGVEILKQSTQSQKLSTDQQFRNNEECSSKLQKNEVGQIKIINQKSLNFANAETAEISTQISLRKYQIEALKMKEKESMLNNNRNDDQQFGTVYWKKQLENRKSMYEIIKEKQNTSVSKLFGKFHTITKTDRWDALAKLNYSNAFDFKFKINKSWYINSDYLPIMVVTREGTVIIPNCDQEIGFTEIARAFLLIPDVNCKLATNDWIKNHYRMILLKLRGYEIEFADVCYGRVCLPEYIIEHMKYRYDVEFYKKEKSCLSQILSGVTKELPDTQIVLSVLDIKFRNNFEEPKDEDVEVLLSDRWYSIKASIDEEMKKLIIFNRVSVGTKLCIRNAELISLLRRNADDGNSALICDPLKIPSDIRLKIHTNSVRSAKYDTKLGFQETNNVISIPLDAISRQGGIIATCKLLVTHMYPVVSVKKASEHKIWPECYSEDIVNELITGSIIYDHNYFDTMYKCLLEETEMRQKQLLEILNLLGIEESPEKLQGISSLNDLEKFVQKNYPDKVVVLKANAKKIKQKLQNERMNVIKLKFKEQTMTDIQKLRVIDAESKTLKSAILSLWNPTKNLTTEDYQNLKIGSLIQIENLQFDGVLYGIMHISNSNKEEIRFKFLENKCSSSIPMQTRPRLFRINKICSLAFEKMLGSVSIFNEIEGTVGVPILFKKTSDDRGVLYLADFDMNLIRINFMKNFKQYAIKYYDLFKNEIIITCFNLKINYEDFYKNDSHEFNSVVNDDIPNLYVSPLTMFFTYSDEEISMMEECDVIKKAILNMKKKLNDINIESFKKKCELKIKKVVPN